MVKFRVLMLTLFMTFVSGAYADEFELGRVTGIDQEKQIVEIDGNRYKCPERIFRKIRKGERIEFIAEYLTLEDKDLTIIEIRSR